jgi:hypothetical protein
MTPNQFIVTCEVGDASGQNQLKADLVTVVPCPGKSQEPTARFGT